MWTVNRRDRRSATPAGGAGGLALRAASYRVLFREGALPALLGALFGLGRERRDAPRLCRGSFEIASRPRVLVGKLYQRLRGAAP